MVMKRMALVLLAGALGLSATAALALRQSGAPQPAALQPAAARQDAPVITSVDSGQPKAPAAESCDGEAMLSAIQEEVEIAPPMTWESVAVKQCRNGYARVLARPGNIPEGQNIEDGEQVFLKESGGAWEVIASGSGIACSDSDRSAELAEACVALGT